MRSDRVILRISATQAGVCQVAVKAGVDEYDQADRLSNALRPAIKLLNFAIRCVYSKPKERSSHDEHA